MSVVARLSFKYSIIGYLGFLLGTVSAIFIFPFDMVFYGKLRFVLSATLMLVPFVVFGLSYSNVYFFGKAKEEGKHQNPPTILPVAGPPYFGRDFWNSASAASGSHPISSNAAHVIF